jgi:hypothetical protein
MTQAFDLDELERLTTGEAGVVVIDRDDMAAMIAEIRALRDENARLRDACQWIVDDPDLPKPFATYIRSALTGEPQ